MIRCARARAMQHAVLQLTGLCCSCCCAAVVTSRLTGVASPVMDPRRCNHGGDVAVGVMGDTTVVVAVVSMVRGGDVMVVICGTVVCVKGVSDVMVVVMASLAVCECACEYAGKDEDGDVDVTEGGHDSVPCALIGDAGIAVYASER